MFDKYKERFKKLEEDHESVRKAHAHIQKYHVYYIAGASGAVCIVGTRLFFPPVVNNIIEQVPPVISPVFNNHNIGNVVNNTVNNVGHQSKIVRRIEDGKIWEKSAEAARELAEEKGITLERAQWLISRNANGRIPDVFGEHYENFGLRTTG